MNKRVLSLTLLLVCFSLVMQAEGRIVEPFNSGWVFKKAPAGKELAVNAPKWESGWTEVEIPQGLQKQSQAQSSRTLPHDVWCLNSPHGR